MPCCSLIYDKRYHSSPSWELIFYILRKVGTFSVDKMEWINCLIWTFSQYLCPTAFHTLQEWFYPYKKMVIQLASRRTLCSCCLSHWVVYVAWCNYFCSTVTGKQYQDNAIRLFARFVGGGAKRRMTFQTTPVLCFAYASRRTKSKRGWSLRVSKWSDFFLCNPFDLSGSPNEGWLYACRTCVIATLRFSLPRRRS